jgi:transcriptional regulator with PAS, ATPase and Fis domain
MENLKLIDHIQTAVAVIDKDMTIIQANAAFQKRNKLNSLSIVGTKCFHSAYKFNHSCSKKTEEPCPLSESFETKKTARAIHNFWVDDHAVVEEVTTTPVLDENGEVKFVIEEFRDITALLGLENGIVGMCSYCRKIRNDEGEWLTIEAYLQKRTGAKFSHGICEECNDNLAAERQSK